MQYLKYVCLFLGIATVSSRHVKFYRKDFKYIYEYDAFYKLYVSASTSWSTAFMICENDDAKLFYPSEEGEWRIVEKLKEQTTEAANVTEVLIGLHNQFSVGEFYTVDGRSSPVSLGDDLNHVEAGDVCVTLDSDTGAYHKGPCTRRSPSLFVCKKMYTTHCPIPDCPTIDTDYKYSPQLNKCYKVNKNAKRWKEAMQTCYMEGGLLANVEDTTDVNRIRNVLSLKQYTSYFIGLHDLFNNGQYYTIRGKNIGAILSREPKWNGGRDPEEYGLEQGGTKTVQPRLGCGILTYESIEASSCYTEQAFICEMEPSKFAK